MYKELLERGSINENGEIRKYKMHRFICDFCHYEYDKYPGQVSKSESGLTFCSRVCRGQSNKKGGLLCNVLENVCLEKYGVISASMTDEFKNKTKETYTRKYGAEVTSALLVPGAREKRKRTHLERYGYEETFQNPVFVEMRANTWFKKYGKKNIGWSENACKNSKLAMEKMPDKWSSKPEILFCEDLCEKFGKENIVRQKRVKKWPIDVYIKNIDTYVQFDGVYWHALNIDHDILKASTKPRDITRYEKWNIDREQDKWFKEKGLTLIRVTDVEYKKDGINAFLSKISF